MKESWGRLSSLPRLLPSFGKLESLPNQTNRFSQAQSVAITLHRVQAFASPDHQPVILAIVRFCRYSLRVPDDIELSGKRKSDGTENQGLDRS